IVGHHDRLQVAASRQPSPDSLVGHVGLVPGRLRGVTSDDPPAKNGRRNQGRNPGQSSQEYLVSLSPTPAPAPRRNPTQYALKPDGRRGIVERQQCRARMKQASTGPGKSKNESHHEVKSKGVDDGWLEDRLAPQGPQPNRNEGRQGNQSVDGRRRL